MSIADTMPIMITQTVAMFVMMAVGIALFEFKYIDNRSAQHMASIALYVATPCVVLRSLATQFDPEKLNLAIVCAVLSIAFTVLSAAISWAIYRDRQRISQLGIMISNMGFVGIPLVQTVIGEGYVFYISVCIAAQVPLTWSYGLWLVTQDKSTVSPKKILTNPAVISVAVGVVLFLFSIELGGVIKVAVDDMAGLNTGLAMIVLGTYLVQTDIRGVIRNPNLYLSNLVRLIIIPLITIAVLMFLPLPTPVKLVILIGFAAPCGTVSAILPQMFGGDYRYGAGLVSSSTLLSLITMPLMLWVGLMLL